MKKRIVLSAIITAMGMLFAINGCVSTRVAEKSGSELWSDNCIRCHNAPASSVYSPDQWEAVAMHMRIRVGLTEVETKKIMEFLKAGN
jgi:hypothetical protein